MEPRAADDPRPGRPEARRSGARRWRSLWPVLLLAALLLAVAVIEGDIPEEFSDLAAIVRRLLKGYGVGAALGLLYLEESGVPLPVPGDVYVVYIGTAAHGSWPKWIAGWLAIIAVVVAGASNLYLISRRWGPRLLSHRLSSAFHLEPARVAQAQAWFERWGPIVIIFGRHIPGFRIPITVVAGTFGVPYRYFAPSVAVSTAVWAGVWMLLGARFGRGVIAFLGSNPWLYVLLAGVVVLVIAWFLVRIWQATQQQEAEC